MSETTETGKRRTAFRVMREARDVALDAWAKIVLGVTSSGAYSRATSILARPGLLALAMARGTAEQLMSRILSELNMPSRADVLSLSVRLTHIETALDDLAATIDALRAPRGRPAARPPARRGSRNGRGAHPPEART